MDAIIAQVQDLASKADEKGRIAIQLALRDLQTSLETPRDTAIRLYNLVGVWHAVISSCLPITYSPITSLLNIYLSNPN